VTEIFRLLCLLIQSLANGEKRVEPAEKVMLNRKEDVRPTKADPQSSHSLPEPLPLFGAISASRVPLSTLQKNSDFPGAIG
jgi:hypothetical protein